MRARFLIPSLSLLVSACSPDHARTDVEPELSPFAENVPISGRVLENVRACEVDAVCYLRLEFADTSLFVTYGTGERPASSCEIPREASDAAFQAAVSEIVAVRVSSCGQDALYLSELARDGR